jgi:hypothetical protein
MNTALSLAVICCTFCRLIAMCEITTLQGLQFLAKCAKAIMQERPGIYLILACLLIHCLIIVDILSDIL